MNRANQGLIPRDEILQLVLSGHSPKALAMRYGVTEWTIKRWASHAERRKQLPYWQQLSGALLGSQSHGERI